VDADALFSCMQLGEAQIMTAGAFDVLRDIQEELLRKANQSDEDVRGDWEIEIDKLRGKVDERTVDEPTQSALRRNDSMVSSGRLVQR
jgi:hypothetical protein